jgi:HD-GYP domain-containing protein (c-di-GMP phosphodiesterase class II)
MLLAEQLVGEARERRARSMPNRERAGAAASALLFLTAAILIAKLLPSNRDLDLPLVLGLVGGYALVMQVRFEVADSYVSAEQLLFVPMLLLLPVGYVPLLVAGAAAIAILPEVWRGSWHWQQLLGSVSECWFSIGPVLVISALAPGHPTLGNLEVYLLAFAAELGGDCAWSLVRDRLRGQIPLREFVQAQLGTARVDAILSSLAFVITLVAADEPLTLVVVGPLVWLLAVFSRDRRERYTTTLELNRAYRGTVMLLADVVEYEDGYTARHSRSVVELVQGVADEMQLDEHGRQELEFAALLHDVGKISVPKEILNKPARLTHAEFELMKMHTIEGQFMLDRVGGLLARVGELVRSCHERWDGGGYPDGLAGTDIPLAARIVFTCDAYNAMTTDRPYRSAISREDALEELASNAGTQFDPDVVAALAKVVQEGEPEARPADDIRPLLAQVQMPERVAASS